MNEKKRWQDGQKGIKEEENIVLKGDEKATQRANAAKSDFSR